MWLTGCILCGLLWPFAMMPVGAHAQVVQQDYGAAARESPRNRNESSQEPVDWRSVLRADARLEDKVTASSDGRPLLDVLSSLCSGKSIRLSPSPEIAQQRVTLQVSDVPLVVVM